MRVNKKNPEKYFSQLLLLGILLILVCFLTWKSPFFLTWKNWRNILDTISVQLLLAIGMNFVIATGGIDLSQGSNVCLTGIVMAICLKANFSVGLAIAIGIFLAALLGIFNGLIIEKIKITPFIVTLGTASLYRGLAIIITEGMPIYSFPTAFTFWGKGEATQLNPPIIIAFIILLLATILMYKTKWGQYSMAIGGNEEALRRVGVNVGAYKVSYYLVSALMAGLVALIITARLNAAEPTAGMGMELDAVTAVVMGGSLMRGGKANISGTIIACLLLGVIKNGLVILSISSYYQQFIIGFLLLSAVILAEVRQRGQVRF
jgi:ribose transport system permease protein